MFDFLPWSKRNSEPEQRIHEEITPPARKRIAHSLRFVEKEDISSAYDTLVELTGNDPHWFEYSHKRKQEQYNFILNVDDQDILLDYLEFLLNTIWRSRGSYSTPTYSTNDLIEACLKVEMALIEEGILIQMKPSPSEEMIKDEWNRNDYHKIIFQQLSDETIIESDQELRVLALGDTWKEPLEGYNEAWQLYKEGTFTYVIPEKLYNSLEAVCERICIDNEEWLDESAGLGDCISELREQGLFKPNDEMVAEWQKIASGIQVGVQRAGGDRKRHEKIDQDYLILLLHQVSSFLTFVIKRYEKEIRE
ncbi:hypothetical protein ACFR9U_04195 [Halorientalis brevis]|uniref:Uncharacterized protein n=1 Tax=Halorientalis brevis TaxID=1126241 RepID=A0ABD6C8X6_9EURY|nr:hypothetical protein [Halorientalis brevis]